MALEGILGNLSQDDKTSLFQGLLSGAGAALASRGNRTQALGQGLLGGVAGYAGGQQQAAQNQYRNMQAQNFQSLAAGRQAEQAKAAKLQGILSQDPSTWTPGLLASGGLSPDAAQGYLNLGKNKVSKYENVRGPDGAVKVAGFDEFGNQVDTGATPFIEPKTLNMGDTWGMLDPVTGKTTTAARIGVSPDARLSADTARRGQDVSAANAARVASTQSPYFSPQASSQGYFLVGKDGRPTFLAGPDGKPIMPSSIDVDVQGAVARTKAQGTAEGKGAGEFTVKGQTRAANAGTALDLLERADTLLDSATGSAVGSLADRGAAAFGRSTPGAQATASLQAIGGQLVSMMPRMEGPQSDADRMLYTQMAGDLANPSVPVATRRAALRTIQQLQQKYAGGAPQAPARTPQQDGGRGGQPARVSSDADYNALPSGAEFVDPSGQRRRKP